MELARPSRRQYSASGLKLGTGQNQGGRQIKLTAISHNQPSSHTHIKKLFMDEK